MKFPNLTMFNLMIVFTLLNLCDVITTMFIFRGESNPLFNLINNFPIMIFLKLALVVFVWIYVFRNLYPSNMSYYMLISILVYGCLALTLAQIINIHGILNPEVIEQAAATPIPERTKSYFIFMNVFYLVPIILSLLTFWIYERSNKTAIIDRKVASKNKWRLWKIQR